MQTKDLTVYDSPEYREFLKSFRQRADKEFSLIVFAGDFTPNRAYAIDELKRETLGEATEVDLRNLITPYEEESYRNIDAMIQDIKDEENLVIFRNAYQLCGVYTGFTSSVQKYATPQEKYFLNKIKELNCPVVLEFDQEDQLDNTVVRHADFTAVFRAPETFIEKMAWKIKQVKVHGSNLSSYRTT